MHFVPKEPANPFGLRWCSLAAEIMVAGVPGGGVSWPFGPWDAHWWPVAAND
jgi:hypothetical protein